MIYATDGPGPEWVRRDLMLLGIGLIVVCFLTALEVI